MNVSICTLFERSYHYGAVGLANSLVAKGFEGQVYAGYRGEMPSWFEASTHTEVPELGTMASMNVAENVHLHLILLDTDYHFTNFKPDFMLKLWSTVASDADAMVYIDPDIVLLQFWNNITKWLMSGVAVCEDVNSPIAEFHPRRVAWREFYGQRGVQLKYKEAYYANGGFVGVTKSRKSFVEDWQRNQELMAEAIGGLNRSSLKGAKLKDEDTGPFAPFGKTDQDALNATIESTEETVSFVGKEAMGFIPGKVILPHALGVPKPWENKPLRRSFRGVVPRYIDKAYWDFVGYPIRVFPNGKIARMRRLNKYAAFVSRFYRKN